MASMIGWIRLIQPGKIVYEADEWVSPGGHKYREGFKSERYAMINDTRVNITSEIIASSSTPRKPVFVCSSYSTETAEVITVTRNTATAAAREILDVLQIKTKKKWSGTAFLGFHRKDVMKIINDGKKNDIENENDLEVNSMSVSATASSIPDVDGSPMPTKVVLPMPTY